jgi:type 1 fimbriae regulatory protein FimB/type 1 fimbriae regulatory protein FimE
MLIASARKRGRDGHRDAIMIPIAYRHGLRVGELRRAHLGSGRFWAGAVTGRAAEKWGSAVHPLGGEEVRALRY